MIESCELFPLARRTNCSMVVTSATKPRMSADFADIFFCASYAFSRLRTFGFLYAAKMYLLSPSTYHGTTKERQNHLTPELAMASQLRRCL